MVYQKRFERTSRLGTWIALNRENVVRLVDFDDLSWVLGESLSNYKIAYCIAGGPLALYCESCCGSERIDNVVYLYNARGIPHPVTPQIQLEGVESVLFMSWICCCDHLIIVLNTGEIRFFDIGGNPIPNSIKIPVPSLCADTGNGVVLMVHEQGCSLMLLEYEEGWKYCTQLLSLPHEFQNQQPSVMLTIPKQFSEIGYTEVFIPFLQNGNTSSLYHCVFHSNTRCCDLRLSIDGGAVVHMALSPNAQSIAFLVRDGSLYVASRSFEDIVRLLNINMDVIPAQLLWCGDKCITYLHLAGQFDESLGFSTTLTLVSAEDLDQSDCLNDIPSDAYLVTDFDGIRILSSDSYHFLQVVSEPARRVFSVGSRAPSAMLLLAFDEFMWGNASSVKMIRDLQKNSLGLMEAVEDCIEVAGFEFDISQQKRLLRVAAFGKSFCSMCESDVFVNMARRLRVLSTLRKSKTGMLISQAQLLALEGDRLAERLMKMGQYQLAYHVCDTLGFSTKSVMTKWALAKLTRPSLSANEEKKLARDVVGKLRECNQNSFADIAYQAYLKQKPHTALLLLEFETIAARQISTLLEIKQPEAALRMAIKNGDTDLIFMAIIYLIENKGLDAAPILTRDSISHCMLFVYIMTCENNRKLLSESFKTHPEYSMRLNVLHYLREELQFVHALNRKGSSWELLHDMKLNAAQLTVTLVRQETATSLNTSGVAAVIGGFQTSSFQTDEKWLRLHVQLLYQQRKLMEQFNDKRFLKASVSTTIALCYEHGCNSMGEFIKKEFSISDKMHCWSMLNGYASTSQWELVDQIGNAKSKTKPIIGSLAFVTTLLACGRIQQAKQYIPKVSRIEWRMEYYVLCNDWVKAGADCRRNGEGELLVQLRERAKGNITALQEIEEGWNSSQESGVAKLARFFS